MPETLINVMRTAIQIKEYQPRGNWPISPRLDDPKEMLLYDDHIRTNGSEDDIEEYERLLCTDALQELLGVKAVIEYRELVRGREI